MPERSDEAALELDPAALDALMGAAYQDMDPAEAYCLPCLQAGRLTPLFGAGATPGCPAHGRDVEAITGHHLRKFFVVAWYALRVLMEAEPDGGAAG